MPFSATLRLARGFSLLIISLLFLCRALKAQEPTQEPAPSTPLSGESNLRLQIDSVSQVRPHIILTNLSSAPLTACALELSYSTEIRRPTGLYWDSLLTHQSPVEKDATLSLPFAHMVGEPSPDKAEVGAAIWADGTTFGRADMLQHLLRIRAQRVYGVDKLIPLMQTGLQEDWRSEQYFIALDKEPIWLSSEARGLLSSIKANVNFDTKIDVRQKIIQTLLDSSIKERDTLRQSKPDLPAIRLPGQAAPKTSPTAAPSN
jgi:hypothetical protein